MTRACLLIGHKFLGVFEVKQNGVWMRVTRPTNYCVRCGKPR